jgi:hypothetical protein
MEKQIKYSDTKNFILVNTQHFSLRELEEVETYYLKVLSMLLLGHPVTIVTKQPQEYSFAQGLGKSHKSKIGKVQVLITEISECSSELLKSISQEEEFKRGLLLLVKADKSLDENEIQTILSIVENQAANLPSRLVLIYCEDDGDSICLFNTGLQVENL